MVVPLIFPVGEQTVVMVVMPESSGFQELLAA